MHELLPQSPILGFTHQIFSIIITSTSHEVIAEAEEYNRMMEESHGRWQQEELR